MDLQISVFLLFTLFTAGHSLDCYECTGSCAVQPVKSCPSGSQCENSIVVTQSIDFYFFSYTPKIMTKACAPVCQSGSMNVGILKMSSSCCNTDLCNNKDAPDLSHVPNGKTCYTCEDRNCSSTVKCSGTEDRCIKATSTARGPSVVVKGCVSKSICDAASLSDVKDISCCKRNLCNGAQSVTQSFLFLCCSLLSYFLLH